jgi:2-polyprenyl-6-methoxyphenol hydroxylase-like FAD-dependent oxidoreductase
MKICIIGGGPIGLFTAIKLGDRLINGTYDIHIYEKRKKYTRNQVVFLRLNRFDDYPVIKRKLLKYVCFSSIHPSENYQGVCFKRLKTNTSKMYNEDELDKIEKYEEFVYLRIKHLEQIFFESVKANRNVKFIYQECNEEKIKKYDIVFSCEGKKSFVRNNILKSNYKQEECFNSYGLILTFEAKKNDKLEFNYNKMKEMDALFHDDGKTILNSIEKDSIQRSKLKFRQNRIRYFRAKDNYTYLALQLSKEEYESIKNVKVYNKLSNYFKRIIKNYLNFFDSKPKKKLDKQKLIVLPFNINLSEKIAEEKNGKLFFVLGDSAHTGSFFSGSNLAWGFQGASHLVNDITNALEKFTDYYDKYSSGKKKFNIKKIIKNNEEFKKFILREITASIEYFKYLIKIDAEETYLPFKIINEIEKKTTMVNLKESIYNKIFSHGIFNKVSEDYLDPKISKLFKFTKKEFMYYLHPLVIQKFSHVYECNKE